MADSPCNNICIIDQKNRLCVGCCHTQEEINNWNTSNNIEKKQIMKKIKI